ncbi:MAG: TIGR00730 family Rossman fold protein [Notoacmeibacter sp.]
MSQMRSVCVYCGSSTGTDTAYVEAGRILGAALAANNLRLVYGGGTKGIMGAVAEGAAAGGGKILGIIPKFLLNKEAPDTHRVAKTEIVVTETMHQRKHLMFEQSDAFVALPGGIGTVEEIIEMMTWGQLGHHSKPLVFANVLGFWDPMRVMLEHIKGQGFLHSAQNIRMLTIEQPQDIVPQLLGLADAKSADGDARIIDRL